MTAVYKDDQGDWMTVCLKYLLFVFNVLFWVGGAAVMGVGIWTLIDKSDYLSLLASSTFAVSAYILILAGALVMVTGFLGCCAVIREQRSCLSTVREPSLELVAGVLAYVYYQRLSEELKQHLNETMTENYAQPGKEAITLAVDRLQQDFKCCGSNNSFDWLHSVYMTSAVSEGRVVPDSCYHPSNIYKTEVVGPLENHHSTAQICPLALNAPHPNRGWVGLCVWVWVWCVVWREEPPGGEA
uniref:Tetraspanin n=1 Tax=Oncorhynchus kisutch TaxID=8019 RepID=A0A8C7IGZ3_ONCKI